MSRKTVLTLSIAALILVLVWVASSQRQTIDVDTQWAPGELGYVATADRKIYAIDLRRGAVVRDSATIEGMGRPTAIAYVPAESMLFVASERGHGQNDYFPLVAVRPGVEFEVARTYTLGPTDGEELRTAVPNVNRSAVFTIAADPGGRTLFLGQAQSNGLSTALFDIRTGTITGRSTVPVDVDDYISPDGILVAEIWPSGSRTVDEGGRSVVQEWAGGVLVREIATGNVMSRTELAANQGLQPPWGAVSGPYLYIKPGTTELTAYDRVTGEITSSVDLRALTGMTPAQPYAIAVPHSRLAAIPMIDAEGRGFIVVIDLGTGEVKSTIEVGPSPTNVVLALSSN